MAQEDERQAPERNAETEREQVAFRERAKAFEAILRANPPNVRVVNTPTEPKADEKPKIRDVLFRGSVYNFKPIGPTAESDRRLISERWQADIRIQDGLPYNVVVNEFRDGRFSPWTFDGIVFPDFLQAAIVGIVAGTYQAKWGHEQWCHERTRRRLMLYVMPAVGVVALMVGFLMGLRHG